jgi:hypothetical protein
MGYVQGQSIQSLAARAAKGISVWAFGAAGVVPTGSIREKRVGLTARIAANVGRYPRGKSTHRPFLGKSNPTKVPQILQKNVSTMTHPPDLEGKFCPSKCRRFCKIENPPKLHIYQRVAHATSYRVA